MARFIWHRIEPGLLLAGLLVLAVPRAGEASDCPDLRGQWLVRAGVALVACDPWGCATETQEGEVVSEVTQQGCEICLLDFCGEVSGGELRLDDVLRLQLASCDSGPLLRTLPVAGEVDGDNFRAEGKGKIECTIGGVPVSVHGAAVLVAEKLAPASRCGDSNDDGAVTAVDALRVLRASVGQSVECPAARCDVDASGQVRASDALAILRNAVGQPVALTCP